MRLQDPPLSTLAIQPPPIALIRRAESGTRFDHAVRAGRLHRIRSGVYVDTDGWEALPPWSRYLARIHAFAMKSPHTVFMHESAAALWGLPTLGMPYHLHARAKRSGGSRRTGDIQWHHTSDEPDVVVEPGIAATSPSDTIVDLARTHHPVIARAAADALARRSGMSPDVLLATNDERLSRRGRAAARWPLATATPLAETALESASLCVIEWLGFERPELQVEFEIGGGSIVRSDCYWRSADVIGEADGRAKYSLNGAGPEQQVWAEKRREDALRRQVRGIARWAWDDVRRPEKLRDILRTAGVAEVRPARRDLLRTLPSHL